eukprot:TRINITY_DN4657_c0_g1_i1.p1 TRINITY_DN4657_c0_g1~~TRINITY_DN4657_c0_g1_i1.p1  ORF type:complete len:418 (+),score=68.04 TRINITY_DN4657_c0_g1_i1:44-1297(+)
MMAAPPGLPSSAPTYGNYAPQTQSQAHLPAAPFAPTAQAPFSSPSNPRVLPTLGPNIVPAYPGSLPAGFQYVASRPLLPQPMMDSAKEDGPVSVAFGLQPKVINIRPRYPCPNTNQYFNRFLPSQSDREKAQELHPGVRSDVCGYAMAIDDPNNLQNANVSEFERMHISHNELRLVFQSISGWILMHWKTQNDFQEGIYGARRAPRPVAWWDLRRAFDIAVEAGDQDYDLAATRITIMMQTGNVYFCLENPEDVPVWYNAIRGVIQDAAWARCSTIDTTIMQRKRWPAAVGTAEAVAQGCPVGPRALAILFYCYDLDLDGSLKLGELMVLVQELKAALIHLSGSAEGDGRDNAVQSSRSRYSLDELFEQALRFRRRCDADGDGKVRREEFIFQGQEAILDALDMNRYVLAPEGRTSC